ncbi:MAG: cytochrome c [Burkholderiales bacterium]|nr:cytochrome c [Burkholderiales bacterium]MDW8468395.1 cytochrome c [Burkholderiales bacterium]
MRRALIVAVALAAAGAAQAGNPEAGRKKAEVCAACHGLDGAKPTAPENPILAGQHYDYLVKALKDYKSGKRDNPVMKGFAAGLSTRDIEDLAAWFASQKSGLAVKR